MEINFYKHKINKRLGIDFGNTVAIVGSFLLGLSAITKSSIFVYALISLLPIGLIKPEYIIPIFYVSSLSSNYFMVAEGLGIARLCALTIMIAIVLKILVGRRYIEKYWLRYLLYIGVITLISFLLGNHQYILSLFVVGMNLMILFSFANMRLDYNQIHQLFKSMYLAVIIITISIYVNAIINPTYISGRMTLSENLNNNSFSIIVAQLTAFLFGYILYTKNKSFKLIAVVLGFANLYLILLSGSRSAFIATIIGVLFTILVMKHKNKEQLNGILLVGFLVIIGFFVFIKVMDQYPVLAYRFNLDNIISSGGTGRWDRIVAEVKYVIPYNLFFGVGPTSLNEAIALQGYLLHPGSSHNILISMITQIGFVGGISYIIFVGDILRKLINRIASKKLLSIPLCLILTGIINGIGEVVYHERFFWSALALGVLCITAYNQDTFNSKTTV